MKISPMAGTPTINPNEGQSAGAGKIARAKAIAAGQTPAEATQETTGDPQVDRLRKIKMKTMVSTDRHLTQEQPTEAIPETVPVEGDKVEASEQTQVASEATKPLSPQLAAIAKQRRILQLKEQEITTQKAAFESEKQKMLEGYISKESLKSSPLKTLLGQGVTYDQLTEEILAQDKQSFDPAELDAKFKSLEEALDKKLNERQAQSVVQQEESALRSMLVDAEALAKEGDTYALIREADAYDRVLRRIYSNYKKTGQVMDVSVAMDAEENKLLEESVKWARINKVQSKLNPAPVQQPQPTKLGGPNTKIMRTLTNRDGVSSATTSKRERAILAMEGRLK